MKSVASNKRMSAAGIRVNPNVRCKHVYPVQDTLKQVADLKTVGFRLDRNQAIDLARVLLSVAQESDEIDVTAFRFQKRKEDQTYRITVIG
jgi:hypothetical protein